jgi:hypothetical protein
MAILDPVSTPLQERTNRALESPDPFTTPIMPTRRLDGQPIAPVQSFFTAQPMPTAPEPEEEEYDDEGPDTAIEDSVEPVFPEAPKEIPPSLDNLEDPIVRNPIHESRSVDGLPSYRCEFAGRDIFIGFPCYKTTNPVTAFALIAMALDFGRDKIRFDMAIGDSKIEHARNRLAHKFLETDAKWMMMIDDDIIPCIGRPEWSRYWVQNVRGLADLPLQRHVLHRLIGAGKTLVGASYFGRQEGGALMASDQSLAPRARVYEDKVVEVDWVATGCILIHRKVFEDIRAKFGDELKIDVPDYDYDYFRPFDSAHGEDVSFCKRAKQAGHQPHLDLGLPVSHLGFKTY